MSTRHPVTPNDMTPGEDPPPEAPRLGVIGGVGDTTCPECDGQGELKDRTECTNCGGTGRIAQAPGGA